MADRRARKKGRQGGTGSFLALPHAWLDSPQFRALSARATKALLGLAVNADRNLTHFWLLSPIEI